jgi:hypothetical protein
MIRGCLFAVFLFTGYGSFAQASTSAFASAEIVNPVSFSKIQDLSFQDISITSAAFRNSHAVRQVEGRGCKPALLNLSADHHIIYDLTIGSERINLVHPKGKMTLEQFLPFYTDGSGTHILNISATLSIEGVLQSGNYTADPLNVIVNYN